MMPVYLVAGILDLLRECWWLVLIFVILVGPRFAARMEQKAEIAKAEAAMAAMSEKYPDNPSLTIDNTGVCKNLAEDARVIVLFLNDDESSWNIRDMKDYLTDAVEPALSFLEETAIEYGVQLSLDYSYYVDNEDAPVSITYTGIIRDGDSESLNPDILEQSATALGFASKWDMLEQDRQDAGIEQIAYLVCANKNGRSYASCVMGLEGTEYMMLYNQIPQKWSRRNGVVHELLHMFGAEDLYSGNGKNANREKLAKQLNRYDVMLEAKWHFKGNVVGPFTAYCIGWLDNLPEEYNCPEWWS